MHSVEHVLSSYNSLAGVFLMWLVDLSTSPVTAYLPVNRSDMYQKLQEARIVPELFDRAPKHILEIKYPKVEVIFGNIISSSLVKQRPTTLKWPSNFTTFYTLIATDPDSYVSRPSRYHEWQHWVVGNIPGNCFLAGETLTPYMGAMAPHWLELKKGLHRFIFTVYEQKKGKIYFTAPRLPAMFDGRRTNFSTRAFADEYELGQPWAINYFRVEPREVKRRQTRWIA